MIPKIIHQIWYQGEMVPVKYTKFQNSWKSNHPSWIYMLWTEEKMRLLVQDPKYEWFKDTWDAFPKFIQRIDAFKLIALFEYGGYYIDMDSECLKPLDSLLSDATTFAIGEFKRLYKVIAMMIGKNLVVNNSFIASVPANAILKDLLVGIKDNFSKVKHDDVKSHSVDNTTGPYFTSFMITDLRKKYPIEVVSGLLVELYPFEIKKYGSGAYIVHHSEMTWKKGIVSQMFRATGNPPLAVGVIILLAGIIIILLIVAIVAAIAYSKRNKWAR